MFIMAGTSLKGTLNNEAVKISAMYPFRELTSSPPIYGTYSGLTRCVTGRGVFEFLDV
jgi:hypothetical protein